MCFVIAPAVMAAITVASVAASAAGSVAAYQGQAQAAKAQAAQQAQQTANINKGRIDEYNQAAQQEIYHGDEAYQKLYDNAQQNRAALATAQTSAGENGLSDSSGSVAALASEYYARQGEFANDVSYNRNADITMLQEQMKGFDAQAQSRINSMTPVQRPSWITPALQIGGSALNAETRFGSTPQAQDRRMIRSQYNQYNTSE